MAPTQTVNVHPQLPPSFSSPNFHLHKYYLNVDNSVSNSNLNLPEHMLENINLDFPTDLTFSNSEKKRQGQSKLNHFQSLQKSNSVFTNEKTMSTESIFIQNNHGVKNYVKPPLKTHEIFRRVRTEVSVLNKLDYEYKREQRCLLELKDKISEVEEEYQEILNKQKEKEKRVKERVQKLKKRFQVVIKFHSYFTKASTTDQHERKTAND